MKRNRVLKGAMNKAADLFNDVAEGLWIVQLEAERRARGLGPEFDLTPRGQLAELARRAAEGAAVLADGTTYLDPMEGFPLAVEALQGLAGKRKGGAAKAYTKAETVWRKMFGGEIDAEAIRRAAACRLACDCAAYRAVAEMRAIEAGEAAGRGAGGVLEEVAKARRTRGRNIPRDVKKAVLDFVERECGGDVRGEGWKDAFDRFAGSRQYTAAVQKHVGSIAAMKRIAKAARMEKQRHKPKGRAQKK